MSDVIQKRPSAPSPVQPTDILGPLDDPDRAGQVPVNETAFVLTVYLVRQQVEPLAAGRERRFQHDVVIRRQYPLIGHIPLPESPQQRGKVRKEVANGAWLGADHHELLPRRRPGLRLAFAIDEVLRNLRSLSVLLAEAIILRQ